MWFIWLVIGLLVGHYVIPDLKKQFGNKDKVVYEIQGKDKL